MPTNGPYSGLPNKMVKAPNDVSYAYRDTGGEGGDAIAFLTALGT
jgi:hypothetical protein